MPTMRPAGTVRETPSMTGASSYAKRTSAACSNAHASGRTPSRRGEAENFLVAAIEQVRDAAEDGDAARDAPRRAGRRGGVAGVVEQSAEQAERRLDVERLAARLDGEKCRRGAAREGGVDKRAMTRPAQQAIANLERRKAGDRDAVGGKDLGREPRVARAHVQPLQHAGAARRGRQLHAARLGV